jgi:hypothetical protein
MGVLGLLVCAVITVQTATPAGAASPSVGGPHRVAGDYYMTSTRAAFDGTNYLVTWSTNGHVWAARASGDGTVVQNLGDIAVADVESNPDVAFNGTNYLVVWQHQYANDDNDIRGQLITKSGDLLGSNFDLESSFADSLDPTITAAGSTYFVAWQDNRGGNPDIYGRRFASTGLPIDSAVVPIATSTKPESDPDVAWNGTTYLVVYELAYTATDSDVYSRQVSATGSLPGTVQTIHNTDSNEVAPAVASNGTGFLVVWADGRSASSAYDVYGARVGAAGTVVTNDIKVGVAKGSQRIPSVAWNGEYLVAWIDNRATGDPYQNDVYAARVSGTGTVLDPNGYAIVSGDAADRGHVVVERTARSKRWAMFVVSHDGTTTGVDLWTSPK